MNDGAICRSYTDVEERFKLGCRRLGLTPRVFGRSDGYCLYVVDTTGSITMGAVAQHQPFIWLSAGIHGDEPAAVLGLLHWLENYAEKRLPQAQFTIVPCLNPYGYERNLRVGSDGRDLNRLFGATEVPLVAAVRTLVAGKRYNLAVDLHEDWEFRTFYLYEVKEEPPYIGEHVVDAMRAYAEISHNEAIKDVTGNVTQHGIIRQSAPMLATAKLAQLPLGRYLYLHHAPHIIGIETPGQLPLETRVQMQARALEEICNSISLVGKEKC